MFGPGNASQPGDHKGNGEKVRHLFPALSTSGARCYFDRAQ